MSLSLSSFDLLWIQDPIDLSPHNMEIALSLKDKYCANQKLLVEEKLDKQRRFSSEEYLRESCWKKQSFPSLDPSFFPQSDIIDSTQNKGAVGSCMGRRRTQEDAYVLTSLQLEHETLDFYAIYDGHSGNTTANYLKENLHLRLLENLNRLSSLNEAAFLDGVYHTFRQINEEIALNEPFTRDPKTGLDSVSGSTAICSIVWRNHLYTFNTGDSCGLLLNKRTEEIIPLNELAKPSSERFASRVKKQGGSISNNRVIKRFERCKFSFALAMTRSFGDRMFPGITSRPKTVKVPLDPDSVLLMSCDGPFEDMNRDVFGKKALQLLKEPESRIENVVYQLIKGAYLTGSRDNLTVLLVPLNFS